MLTEEQAKWLFSSSGALERVSLTGIYSPALPAVIQSSVKFLQLETSNSYNQHLARVVSAYESLTCLRIMGSDWPWGVLFDGNCKSLQGISYWQPRLHTITVLAQHAIPWPWDLEDPEIAIPRAQQEAQPVSLRLKNVCELRKVALHWFNLK
ncbi:hypothetical protein C8R44DRAFT_866184 [Mycena epipterygia]|nr:hypothetical protein C8R44DRAFT_866184 [Mycena epipterygia]